ncbi:hypothetical protein BGZ72_005978 [Mortierella alpina]|nr:hypothetical protein BGZ72_005978 [Mortierella alpina]
MDPPSVNKYDLMEETEEHAINNVEKYERRRESSAAHLRALQSALTILVESPCIAGEVNAEWVRKCAFKSDRFSEEECSTVAKLANILRQFGPKKIKKYDGSFAAAAPHDANYAALVRIANTFLKGAGYDQFCQRESPTVSPASVHALNLGAVGLYKILCAKAAGHFGTRDTDHNLLSNYKHITIHPRKQALSFCDKYAIRLTGEQIKHGGVKRSGMRTGYPESSQYDKRNSLSKRQSSSGEVEIRLKKQDEATLRVKKKESGAYKSLIDTRQSPRAIRSTLLLEDEKLKALRQQKLPAEQDEQSGRGGSPGQGEVQPGNIDKFCTTSVGTAMGRPAMEDSIKFLDLLQLRASSHQNKVLTDCGTDRGIVK